MVALVPPSEEPPIAGGPGSGGFIESVDLGDVDLAQKVDRLPAEVKRHLSWMHAALGEPADTAILLSVDGRKTMWLEFWSKSDHLEQVADLLEHVQNAVMETTHERWPVCPAHAHELLPRAHDEWIAWECPDTEEAIAPFGQLTSRSA
jgi:hypothetical protein